MQVKVLGGDYDSNYVTFEEESNAIRHTSDSTTVSYGKKIVIHSSAKGTSNKLISLFVWDNTTGTSKLEGRTCESKLTYEYAIPQPETGNVNQVYIFFTVNNGQTAIRTINS